MNFKYLLALSIPAILSLSGNAASLTPSQAVARLNNSGAMKSASINPSQIEIAPVYTALNPTNGDMPLYYVFDRDTSGFVIVSADDCAVPMLGYSEYGKWDTTSMSPEMRWWLDQYEHEIAAASTAGVSFSSPSRVKREAISPLLTTKWNQNSPYNDMCPLYGTTATYTGCVATAVSQVMKYHNWPEKGTGSNSYTWNRKTLSMDFSTVTFDWANMTDTYGNNSTDVQKQAVAQLMNAVGISVNMNYGTSESGAQVTEVAPALVNYFGYDKSIYLALRELYSISEWEDLVYGELKARRPVIYAGVSNEGGHCFVCDGCNTDGYFHINWGWGGMSDGYFLLSALAPEDQGIGGSNSAFNSGQMIIGNVKKAEEGSVESDPVIACSNMVSASISRTTLTLLAGFYNYSTRNVTGSMRLKAVNQETGAETMLSGAAQAATFKIGEGYMSISASISSLANGSYRIYPVFVSADGSTYPIKVPTTQLGYALLDKNSTSTVEFPASGQFTVTDVTMNSELYWGSDFSVSGTLDNDGVNDITISVYPVLLSQNGYSGILAMGSAVTLDVPAGGAAPINYLGKWVQSSSSTMPTNAAYIGFVTPGTIVRSGTSYSQTYTGISDPLPIQLNEGGVTSVSVIDWNINNGDNSNVNQNHIPVSVTLQCDQGYFGGSLEFAIFPMLGGTSLYSFPSPTTFLSSGNSETINFSGAFPTGNPGSRYSAAIFYGESQLSSLKRFVLSKDSGIIEVANETDLVVAPNPAVTVTEVMAPSLIDRIEIYSLSGNRIDADAEINGNHAVINVDSLPSGLYIIAVTTAEGTITTKLIRQ